MAKTYLAVAGFWSGLSRDLHIHYLNLVLLCSLFLGILLVADAVHSTLVITGVKLCVVELAPWSVPTLLSVNCPNRNRSHLHLHRVLW